MVVASRGEKLFYARWYLWWYRDPRGINNAKGESSLLVLYDVFGIKNISSQRAEERFDVRSATSYKTPGREWLSPAEKIFDARGLQMLTSYLTPAHEWSSPVEARSFFKCEVVSLVVPGP